MTFSELLELWKKRIRCITSGGTINECRCGQCYLEFDRNKLTLMADVKAPRANDCRNVIKCLNTDGEPFPCILAMRDKKGLVTISESENYCLWCREDFYSGINHGDGKPGSLVS